MLAITKIITSDVNKSLSINVADSSATIMSKNGPRLSLSFNTTIHTTINPRILSTSHTGVTENV